MYNYKFYDKIKYMKKKVFIWSLLFVFLDQLSKILLNNFLVVNKSYEIFAKFLYINVTYNDGISFSMLGGQRVLIILISLIIMFVLFRYMKTFKENKKNILAFALIYGGLFGNLIDRIVYGYVIDFLDFYVLSYDAPIFNLADSFICIGIGLLLYAVIKGEDSESSGTK